MNFNIDAKKQNTFDAIVIGSGMSGGWAAKELCEKGLRTLVLERGRDVNHITDYPTAMKNPWDFDHHNRLPPSYREENPIASRCYALDEATQHFFTKDTEQPYIQEKPFDWIRAYQVGGKSLLWARQVQRWSKYDFEGPARDGYAVPWPVTYDEMAPWYSYVEKFAGISGNKDGLDILPDGEFLPPWELNCVEKHLQTSIKSNYQDRHLIVGRCAHLTKPQPWHTDLGRAQCQARHLCYRGCPFGAYFSSQSATLPAARRTGKLTLRPHSVVESIIFDEKLGKATGVRIIDAQTNQVIEYFAKIIFVNASCLASNQLLLNSTSKRFPNGLGNDNGLLGRYVAFHNYRGSVNADIDGFMDQYYFGRRPTMGIMPRFQNVGKQETDFLRGYLVALEAGRSGWGHAAGNEGFGADWKEANATPGPWHIFVMLQGETIPKHENHLRLSADKKDKYGIPQLITSVGYDENDERMLKHFFGQASEMLQKAGFKNIRINDDKRNPGLDIHEMGGVRMGADPKTSLVNKWNQLHTCKNVFVTDGAAMTSTSTQNPSLTFMAFTARAAHHAVQELKKKNL
ncbi:MAG: GMC family oxidoreductase [Spirosomaceae bacterium]|jgi:choline dehydrogenase-like flavoprotein|nr:GMC family oxidoreductase [Spirosomataceae bacterium]